MKAAKTRNRRLMRSRKTSDVVQVEKVHRSFQRSSGPNQTSDDLEAANPIEVDTRHYCRLCKRKREERFMRVFKRAAFGKMSWVCADDVAMCRAVMTLKQNR